MLQKSSGVYPDEDDSETGSEEEEEEEEGRHTLSNPLGEEEEEEGEGEGEEKLVNSMLHRTTYWYWCRDSPPYKDVCTDTLALYICSRFLYSGSPLAEFWGGSWAVMYMLCCIYLAFLS